MKLDKQIFIPSLSGFQFGYSMSIIAGVGSHYKKFLSIFSTPWDCSEHLFVRRVLRLHFCRGLSPSKAGRKKALFLSALMFGVGSLVSAFANSGIQLVIGRFLLGLGGGIATIVAPIYLVETAPSETRGSAVDFYQIQLCTRCFGCLSLRLFTEPF